MKTKERVLKYCNRVRRQIGLRPKKRLTREGEGSSSLSCPVASTIKSGKFIIQVGTAWMNIYKDYKNYHSNTKMFKKDHPKYIKNFIMDFDLGKYPELGR